MPLKNISSTCAHYEESGLKWEELKDFVQVANQISGNNQVNQSCLLKIMV